MTGDMQRQRLSFMLKIGDRVFPRAFAGDRFSPLFDGDAEGATAAAHMSGWLNGQPAAMASRTASSARPYVREGALALRDGDNDVRQVLVRIAWPLAPRITIQPRLHVTGIADARQ
jgi:hypothetical protein